eukprot:6021382-Amphidinium_carterae.1
MTGNKCGRVGRQRLEVVPALGRGWVHSPSVGTGWTKLSCPQVSEQMNKASHNSGSSLANATRFCLVVQSLQLSRRQQVLRLHLRMHFDSRRFSPPRKMLLEGPALLPPQVGKVKLPTHLTRWPVTVQAPGKG